MIQVFAAKHIPMKMSWDSWQQSAGKHQESHEQKRNRIKHLLHFPCPLSLPCHASCDQSLIFYFAVRSFLVAWLLIILVREYWCYSQTKYSFLSNTRMLYRQCSGSIILSFYKPNFTPARTDPTERVYIRRIY